MGRLCGSGLLLGGLLAALLLIAGPLGTADLEGVLIQPLALTSSSALYVVDFKVPGLPGSRPVVIQA